MAYLTQEQASVYSSTIGGMTEAAANAWLEVASDQVDLYCQRTFDYASDEFPPSVAMAVALWAEELSTGTMAGRDKTSERIGDYAVTYENNGNGGVEYPCPLVVATLLSPYRIIVCG